MESYNKKSLKSVNTSYNVTSTDNIPDDIVYVNESLNSCKSDDLVIYDDRDDFISISTSDINVATGRIHNKNVNALFNTDNLNIVEHPNHYGANDNIQCIEAMLQTFGKEDTMAFCKLNSFKYIWRSQHKGTETQDMEKAKRYLEYWDVLNKLESDKDDGTFHKYLNNN